MCISPKYTIGLQNFTLSEVKPYARDAKPPRHSHTGCRELGWTVFYVAVFKPNSTYSLEIGSSFL